MSIEAISWASRQKIPPRDKFVLVALCDHYNRDEQCAWMKQETLAAWTGYTRVTVNAALDALEHKHKLITSETRRYKDGRNAAKVYRLNLRVKEIDSGESRVNDVYTDRVNVVDPDRVKEIDNKNQEHRTVNKEPKKKEIRKRKSEEVRPEHAPFLEAWNANRGPLPAAHTVDDDRARNLDKLIAAYGDEALDRFTDATKRVATEPWWIDNAYGFENLIRGGKVLSYSEKWRAAGAANPARGSLVTAEPHVRAAQQATSLLAHLEGRRAS